MSKSDDINTTSVLQAVELEMLKSLSVLLKENGIPFFLACGTALGCVRHRGFIPWDDDIDIYIFGKDYPRLKELFETKDTGNLSLHDFTTMSNYPYTFPKVVLKGSTLVESSLANVDYKCGVYIDVFPLMVEPDGKCRKRISESLRYIRYCLIRLYYHRFSSRLVMGLQMICRLLINPMTVHKRLYKQYVIWDEKAKAYIDTGVFGRQSRIDARCYSSTEMMDFEDAIMPMPSDYHKYLSDFYGNYMELPDASSRVSSHQFKELVIGDMELF